MKNLTTIIAGSLVALAFLALGSQAYAFESAADIQARLTELREIHADLKAQGVDISLVMLARLEGVILDPVYGGKAFHALSQLWHAEPFARMHDVLFIHTGGLHGLYAHAEALAEVVG